MHPVQMKAFADEITKRAQAASFLKKRLGSPLPFGAKMPKQVKPPGIPAMRIPGTTPAASPIGIPGTSMKR